MISSHSALQSQACDDRLSRVEIDLAALASNLRWIRSRVGAGVGVMAVVKANAYGHGAPAIAKALAAEGVDALAVANLGEALELRAAGVARPILVLSYVSPEAIPLAIAQDLRLTLYDLDLAAAHLAAASQCARPLKLHLKIDSGMGRLGLLPGELDQLGSLLRGATADVEGVYTHFASADDDPAFTRKQLAVFEDSVSSLRAAGFHFERIHAANSAAVVNCRESAFNMVRPGVLLYGLQPMPERQIVEGLRAVMRWTTVVAQVKTLPSGSPVGYGGAYRTRRLERIAVLPVGYADGLRRTPSSWREVLIRGRRAPLVGRVNMEKISVNVSQIPDVKIGDEATLLGRQGDEAIRAEEIAEWIDSNNYEVATSVAPRSPRVLV